MKRMLTLLLLLILVTLLSAETYSYQGFEESDTWNYTAQPTPSRLIYWGPVNTNIGSASPYEGEWYWASWDLDSIASSLTFENMNLPLGYSYSLQFYYFTAGLNPATEYSRYAISTDGGMSWGAWINLLPNANAWTLVNVNIPAYASQLMLKVEAKHDGIGKFAHWDHFLLERQTVPPTAPMVYDISAVQRNDGSGLVDIHYSLFDANNDASTVSVLLADGIDAPYSYTPNPVNLSGDIGSGIANGNSKHIIWNAAAEGIDYDGSHYRIKVVADDGTTFGAVATPVFTPPAGSYSSAQNVTITCATEGAAIYYTTDGSAPDASSSLYSSAIALSTDTTLKAIAMKADWDESAVAEAVYEIESVPAGFVYVPGGTITMGDTRGTGFSNELPTHIVTLNSFYMAKYEVTQGEYQAIMGSNPSNSYGVGTSYPVYYVNWYSAIKYCNLKSMADGLTPVYTISGSTNPATWGTVPTSNNATWDAAICNWSANGYRLPTEAEWEYAARGATNTPDYLYSGSDDVNAVAWYELNSGYTSHPVGTKAPNSLGLQDMSGNLWEWCWDWYSSTYYSSSPASNPTGASSGSARVLRGGNWDVSATNCRVAYRNAYNPYVSGVSIGFRLSRSASSFVYVEGGTFNNGTSDVTVSSFYIDKYETTQNSYLAVMGNNPSSFSSVHNSPVEQVNWYNAIEYCNRRSMQEGLTPCYSYSSYGTNPSTWPAGWNSNNNNHTNVSCNWTADGYRLPTDMEWMFAAKGGNQSQGYTYSGSNTIGNVAWYYDNSYAMGSSHPDYGTHTVGTKAGNELGLYDMSGNVWEWVWDIYGDYPSGSQNNPTGANSGDWRAFRGGCWSYDAYNCTVSYRNAFDALYGESVLGFRCVRVSP